MMEGFPALGEPAEVAQDDGPPLPRHQERRDPEVVDGERGKGQGHLRRRRRQAGPGHGTSSSIPSILTSPSRPTRSSSHATTRGHTVFAYVIDGKGVFCNEKNPFAYDVEGANYFDMERDPTSAMERRSSSATATR